MADVLSALFPSPCTTVTCYEVVTSGSISYQAEAQTLLSQRGKHLLLLVYEQLATPSERVGGGLKLPKSGINKHIHE